MLHPTSTRRWPGRPRAAATARQRDVMETRRIALVTETFYPAVDGTTTTLKQVADHLIDAGHEVLVVAPGPGPGDVPAQPGGADPPVRQARSPGARGAGAVRAGPRACRLPRHPGPQGAQARAAPRRADARGPARADHRADPRALAGQGRGPRRPARGDVRLPRRPPAPRSGSSRPCGSPASTPAPSHPGCATSGCTTSGRAPGPATGARSWSGTPAACTSATAYAAWWRSRTCPAMQLVVIGDGPQRVWLRRHVPAASFTGALTHRRPRRGAGLARRARAPRRGGDVLPRRSARPPRAGCPWSPPAPAVRPGVVRDLETGLLYDPHHRHRPATGRRGRGRRPSPRRSWASAAASSAPALAGRLRRTGGRALRAVAGGPPHWCRTSMTIRLGSVRCWARCGPRCPCSAARSCCRARRAGRTCGPRRAPSSG